MLVSYSRHKLYARPLGLKKAVWADLEMLMVRVPKWPLINFSQPLR